MRFVLCLGLLFYLVPGTRAQNTNDRLQALLRRHSADTVYLKGVDSLAPQLLNDDSLPQELIAYRQIAFRPSVPGKFRMRYYRYLALQAFNKGRFGTAVYYSDKNNEEGIRAGIFQAGEIPHSDLFAISMYLNDHDYARAFAKYDSLRVRIRGLAALIPQGKVSAEEAFVAFSIINQEALAASESKNNAIADEMDSTCRVLLAAVDKYPTPYAGGYRLFYSCVDHTIRFVRDMDRGGMDSAHALLDTAITEVKSPGFLRSMQPYNTFDLYQDAFDFFIKTGRTDSARNYLDLARELQVGLIDNTSLKTQFLLEGSSQLEALNRDFPAAYRDLRKAYDQQDSALHATTSDKDNNLYALAEAENTRAELVRREEEARRMEQANILLFFALAILLLLVLSGYFILTSRAKQRMLRHRLGLARNFHDEVGPMLLYAGTLVKKEAEEHPTPRLEELKGHLVHVMEAVRGITHDLKSNDLSTVTSLSREINGLLEKIHETTGIDFTLRQQGPSRVLSHFQHTHLKKIISELISNSIRHSGCTLITAIFQVDGRHLSVQYADNGKGVDFHQENNGIGLQNVKERIGLLNGTIQQHDQRPGYAIDLKIPLL